MRAGLILIGMLTSLVGCTPFRAPQLSQKNSQVTQGKARFTIVTPTLIRMEYDPSGKFVDDPSMFAIHREARWSGAEIEKKSNTVTIDTKKIRLTFIDNGQAFSSNNLSAEITGDDGLTRQWKFGQKNLQNLGGTVRSLDDQSGPVDLKEGILARDGWYVLDDSESEIFKNNWVYPRERKTTDLYFFGYGAEYKEALKSFAIIGGKVPMPRKYALGNWYSRFWKYSDSDFKNIADEFDAKDFPLDMMVLDMEWHKPQWNGYSFERNLFPNPEKFLKDMHQRGIHVTLNDHLGDVEADEPFYASLAKDLGKTPNGKPIEVDARSKSFMDLLFKHAHFPLEDIGVDFWWLDYFDISNQQIMNWYYFNQSTRNDKRGQIFSRWGGLGGHRYAIQFSGDTITGFDMLKFQVAFTATAGNMGAFFWSHDIGGHKGTDNEEIFTRWVQFGATTTTLRPHVTASDIDRRPWLYSKSAERSMRESYHLRSQIFPYLYSTVATAHRETLPINRPMYIEYANSPEAYENPQQYLLGSDILVAPVTSAGEGLQKVASQRVWFPGGDDWYDIFTGTRYEGNQTLQVKKDLSHFPIYARAGRPIPMQPKTLRMTQAPLSQLVIRTYSEMSGRTFTTELYEDDGASQGYLRQESATTRISYTNQGARVVMNIEPTVGSFNGQLEKRAYRLEFPSTFEPSHAIINGRRSTVQYDSSRAMTVVEIPETDIRQPLNIEIQLYSHWIACSVEKGHHGLGEQEQREHMQWIRRAGNAPGTFEISIDGGEFIELAELFEPHLSILAADLRKKFNLSDDSHSIATRVVLPAKEAGQFEESSVNCGSFEF